MKNPTKLLFAAMCCLATFFACKKDGTPLTDEEILNNKISEIIPQEYIDTLIKLGLPINEGTTPVDVTGAYVASPNLLLASNIPTDTKDMKFLDGYFRLFGQNNKDFSINLLGKNFLNKADTSIVTAISGVGNNFTVYGKVKSTSGSSSAIFAILLSGTKNGSTITGLKYGLINIDGSKDAAGVFIKEGQARITYDQDGVGAAVANYDGVQYKPSDNSSLKLGNIPALSSK